MTGRPRWSTPNGSGWNRFVCPPWPAARRWPWSRTAAYPPPAAPDGQRPVPATRTPRGDVARRRGGRGAATIFISRIVDHRCSFRSFALNCGHSCPRPERATSLSRTRRRGIGCPNEEQTAERLICDEHHICSEFESQDAVTAGNIRFRWGNFQSPLVTKHRVGQSR